MSEAIRFSSDELDTITSALADRLPSGGSVELTIRDADYRFVVSVEPDDCTSGMDEINGCDCYGRVAYVDRYPRNDQGRPADFTGAARKLTTYHGGTYWWEPYREGHKVYDTPEDRQQVLDILTYGMSCMALKVQTMCDRGHWHTVRTVALGGIEPFADNDYLSSVLSDLLSEVAA